MRFSQRIAREIQARAQAAARAADAASAQWKLVRAADEDDDRRRFTPAGVVYANPRYRAARDLGRGHGWCGAFNLRRTTLEAVDDTFVGCAGFFGVFLQRQGGAWSVVCSGNDDTTYRRTNLPEQKARRFYDAIRDHTTIRTLLRWGFRGE